MGMHPVSFETKSAAVAYSISHGGVAIGRGSEFGVIDAADLGGYPDWSVVDGSGRSTQFSLDEDVQFAHRPAAGQGNLDFESKHPRDDAGKFAEKEGGGGAALHEAKFEGKKRMVSVPPKDDADDEEGGRKFRNYEPDAGPGEDPKWWQTEADPGSQAAAELNKTEQREIGGLLKQLQSESVSKNKPHYVQRGQDGELFSTGKTPPTGEYYEIDRKGNITHWGGPAGFTEIADIEGDLPLMKHQAALSGGGSEEQQRRNRASTGESRLEARKKLEANRAKAAEPEALHPETEKEAFAEPGSFNRRMAEAEDRARIKKASEANKPPKSAAEQKADKFAGLEKYNVAARPKSEVIDHRDKKETRLAIIRRQAGRKP